MDKVINTILTLKDNLSGPLKAASKVSEVTNENLERVKEQVRRYEKTIANASKNVDLAKATMSRLSKEYSDNSKQIEKVKNETEKYDNLIASANSKSQSYRKSLDDTKTKLEKLESAQVATQKALESAQKAGDKASIGKLSKEYSKNATEIEKTKSSLEKYTNQSKIAEQKLVSYAKRLEESKSRLKALEKAQGENTKEVETARKVITDYEKVISKQSEQLNKAKTKMREYSKTMADATKRAEEGKRAVEEWGKSAEKSMDNIVKRSLQVVGAITTVVGAFAIKEGFGEAMNLEGYKMQLETATKSTEKAGQLMSKAIKFANSTPFETGEVVEATAKMEAYGISSERWLKDVADMAGATNKSIDQATEAMADAVMGEWTRLKEFGIKKEELIEAAAKKYGKNVVFNKKGQVKDQIKLEETLQKVMQEKFEGGAKKQAETLKGLWSTVTGVTKSSLAKIVGITEQGTVRQGSLYEKLKQQVERVVNLLNKWQEDGTIDAIAEKVTNAVEEMILFFRDLFDFISRHRTLIETMLVFVGSVYLATKAIALVTKVMSILNTVMLILNGTIALNPMTILALKIGAVIAICYLLWKNLDLVINTFKKVFAWIKNILDSLGPFGFALAALLGPIGLVISGVLFLIQHFETVKSLIMAIPSALSTLKKFVVDCYNSFMNWAGSLIEAFLSLDLVKSAIDFVVTAVEILSSWFGSIIGVIQQFYGWIKSILDMLGPFGFAFTALLGPIGLVISGVLGLIQHFDKLKEAGEKVWGFVKKIFGADDTEIKATTEENSNSKITEEKIQNVKNSTPKITEEEIKNIKDNPKGIGAKKLPDIKISEKKPDPYFGEDKRFAQGKETSKKQETKVEIIIQGDVYGMDDFNEKVAEAVVKMVEQNKANVVR